MADPFADASDVAARWRPLTSDETTVAQTLCMDASTLIRQRFPGIDSQVTSGAVDPNILTMVCAGMVKRALVAPDDGVSAQTETTGPYGRSRTYANPLQNVFLTAADQVLILGYQPAGQSNCYANTTSHCGTFGDEVNLYYDVLTILP